MDWTNAESYLGEVEKNYASIGSVGYFGLIYVIRPIRDRFNKGERTQELYDEIMEMN